MKIPPTTQTLLFKILLLISFQILFIKTEKRISSVNMLLPVCSSNCNKVYDSISAKDGCYSWSTDRPELVSLKEIKTETDNERCRSKVELSPITKSPREYTVITAYDLNSNEQFHCKLGFAEISYISIEKSFDRLNVDEEFELHVQAHDSHGNLFSSLEGLKFNWKILEGFEYAEILKLKEQKKKMYEYGRKFAEEDAYSDIIIVKGKNAGKVKIQVEILEEGLKEKIKPDIKTLYILDPFEIRPKGPLYFAIDTEFRFDIYLTRAKRFITKEEHKFYSWSIADISCGNISNSDFGYFHSNKKICSTVIKAKDIRLESYNEDMVDIHVVNPNGLELLHMPINQTKDAEIIYEYKDFKLTSFWKLVEKKNYLIQNFLMYDNHPVIFNIKNNNFKININSIKNILNNYKCLSTSNEKCIISTNTYSLKENSIESSIVFNKIQLHNSNKVVIYPQVKIEKYKMPYFTLPLLMNEVKQELYLNISGGTNKYIINSSNLDIIGIENNKFVYANKDLGESIITVSDQEVKENYDTVIIKTRYVNVLTYFEERQEIEVNHTFEVTPISYHEQTLGFEYNVLNIFTNCTRMNQLFDAILNNGNVEKRDSEYIDTYNKINKYLLQNEMVVKNKIDFNQKGVKNYEDYLKYSNFGICGIRKYFGLKEGLVNIEYVLHQNKDDKMALNPAKIYLFNPLEHIPILTDIFTQEYIKKSNINNPDKEKVFILPKGISLLLNMKGGVIPWSGMKNYYKEELYAYDKYNKISSISNIKKYIQIKAYDTKKLSINCYKSNFENLLKLQIYNQPDKTLLKPAINEYTFKVGCYEPKHLSMFLLSHKDNSKVPMYVTPQPKGLKYYEEKNYTDIIRVYALDEHNRMMVNITLLAGRWKVYYNNGKTLSNQYYEMLSPKSYDKYNIKLNTSCEFFQEAFLFKNYIQTFNIMYSMKKDIVSHYLIIELIDIPQLLPETANIYVKCIKPFEVKVIGGSGDFNITNSNPQLANINYNPSTRTIFIQPIYQGTIIINLIDNYISTHVVNGIYHLVDVKKLTLQENDMIMINKTDKVFLKAIDTMDNYMPEEQMRQISLTIENTNSKQLITSFDYNQTNINIKGLKADIYQIKVRDINSGIVSNDCQIEVFNALEIFPPYLLLVPGSSYTLSVRGGPSKKELVQLKYTIVNTDIAEVASEDYPLVKAKLIGETKLKITLSYLYKGPKFYVSNEDKKLINNNQVLCVEEVPVTVAFPEKAEIVYTDGTRNVYTGATIRLFSSLKKEDKVFTYGTGPFKFYWDVDSQRIAKMMYYMKTLESDKESMFCDTMEKDKCNVLISTENDKDPSSTLGVFLKTVNEGIVSISLRVEIDYPYPYQSHLPSRFEINQKLTIKDEIFINLPEFYGTNPKSSGIYLLPYNIDHELSTNKRITSNYKLIQQYEVADGKHKNIDSNIISLTPSGRVTTHFKTGVAFIQITTVDNNKDNTNINVPISLPIFVTDFYSIFIERTDQLIEVEIGQELNLKVVIQHESGLIFAEKLDRMKLSVIESHPRIATSELIESNSKLKIKAHTLGTTNIILFHPITRRIYDVFRINVNKDVSFMKKILINVGGTISFLEKNPTIKKQMTKNSIWVSDNIDIMTIEKYTGFAKALSEGIAVISLKTTDGKKTKLSIKVEVRKIFSASLDRGFMPASLTDIKTHVDFKNNFIVPINFYSEINEKMTMNKNDTMNEIDHGVKVKCISDNTNIFIAKSTTDNKDPSCHITIRESKFTDNAIKPKDITLKLNIETLSTFNKKYRSVKEYLERIPFSSSFKIKNNIKELNFTHSNREYVLHIDSLNDLNFTISDQNLFNIETNYAQNTIKIKIPHKIVDKFTGEKLTILNILSGQQEDIIINFGVYKDTSIFGSYGFESLTDILMVVTLCLAFIVLILFCKYKNIDIFGNLINFLCGKLFGDNYYGRPNNNVYRPNNNGFNNNYNNYYNGGMRNPMGRPNQQPVNYRNFAAPGLGFGNNNNNNYNQWPH